LLIVNCINTVTNNKCYTTALPYIISKTCVLHARMHTHIHTYKQEHIQTIRMQFIKK